jgi:plasmid stabilization system protein ParE
MVQINWTRIAVEDLKSIYEFISQGSRKYAQLEIIKIKTRTRILKTKPLAGKEVIEKGNVAIRELVEGNYRIIYKIIDKQKIDILTIHHSARDLNTREIL